MAYPMGSATPLAIGERVEQPDAAPATGSARLPLSTADGPGGGDAAGLVRSLLDEQVLDEFMARMRTDGARPTGPGGVLTEILKAVLERGLQAELTGHLGYDKHDAVGRGTGNSRNGATPKTVFTGVSPGTRWRCPGTGPVRSNRSWYPRANGVWAACPTSSSASTRAG